jgi:hypothetical protein
MSYFFLSLGCLFLLTGIGYLAYLMSVPEVYALGTAVLLLSVAAFTSSQATRRSRI